MKNKKLSLLALGSVLCLGLTGVLASCSSGNEGDQSSSKSDAKVDTGLTLSQTELTLNVKETVTIVASTSDDSIYAIFWASSNKEVATVRSGTIMGVAPGEATITVSVRKKGSTKVLETSSVKVTVTNHSLKLNASDITISMSESSTYQLIATIEDDNKNLEWSSSNPDVATVDQTGLVTAKKSGETTISVTNGKLTATCLVHVRANNFTLDEQTIATIGQTKIISVNGNPSSDAIWSIEDDAIASIENGTLTPKAKGMTRIHLKSETDGVDAITTLIVKEEGESTELVEGKKDDAANNPKNWIYLRENLDNVLIENTPTIEGGLINLNITRVGDADGNLKGANYFYLRYQPDETGDIQYKETIYFYAEKESLLSINGGADTTYPAGLNKIETTFQSSSPKDGGPAQIKFKSTGKFSIIPVFEQTGLVKKMKLSETSKTLDLAGEKEFTLTASIPGEEGFACEWSTDNEKVATVSNGLVKAVGEGVAVITAIYESYSATCTVTVEDSTVIDTRVDLTSGKNADVIANPGKWYYYVDDGAKAPIHKIGEDGKTIDMTVTKNVNSSGSPKFTYLRYAPTTSGKWTASYSITYEGNEDASVILSGGSDKTKPTVALSEDATTSGTFEFEFPEGTSSPFQFKFNALGSYQFVVTFSQNA